MSNFIKRSVKLLTREYTLKISRFKSKFFLIYPPKLIKYKFEQNVCCFKGFLKKKLYISKIGSNIFVWSITLCKKIKKKAILSNKSNKTSLEGFRKITKQYFWILLNLVDNLDYVVTRVYFHGRIVLLITH